LDARKLGAKIGYELEYKRRKFERASRDMEYVERWKALTYGPPQPLNLPPSLKDEKVVHVFLIERYDDWTEYAVDSLAKWKLVLEKILRLSAKLGPNISAFTKGLAEGSAKAQAINLDDDLEGIDEYESVVRILENNYEMIAQLRNRTELADFIIARLPEHRREFLKNVAQYRSFSERLRHTYFTKIELKLAARGMPRKSEKSEPRRSRILIYTPDIKSEREKDS
jgi:hypothetical protein